MAQANEWTQDTCHELRREAAQFHQRAAAFLTLGEHTLAALDCARNIEAVAEVRRRCPAEFEAQGFEGVRCAAILLRTRSLATAAVRANKAGSAIKVIDAGLTELGTSAWAGGGGSFERMSDESILRAMRDSLVPRLPSSQRVELEERLAAALRAENYELAAILKSELRQITP
ncbi:MAG: hypothetical protein EXS03_05690 [Phycisphaerales bacterium]|nr:hypothetical protein [Phycisphaerales bacterium]